jgi:hypothetical protein
MFQESYRQMPSPQLRGRCRLPQVLSNPIEATAMAVATFALLWDVSG